MASSAGVRYSNTNTCLCSVYRTGLKTAQEALPQQQGAVLICDAVGDFLENPVADLQRSNEKRLRSLGSEEIVTLKVDGKVTGWERQRDGRDGRPARGLKPCDARAKELWRSLYPSRKGDMVSIAGGDEGRARWLKNALSDLPGFRR